MLKVLQERMGKNPDKLSHHAYLFSGETEEVHKKIKELLHTIWNIPLVDPPLIFEYIHNSFGINEARQLQVASSRKGFGDKQFFIIRVHTITREAQNGLLKLFEEPSGSIFFLLVTEINLLLPTLKSRFQYISLPKKIPNTQESAIFLKGTVAERLQYIAPILKERNREAAEILLSELLEYAEKEKFHDIKEQLTIAEYCLKGPSPSVKQILEGLAYALPRM